MKKAVVRKEIGIVYVDRTKVEIYTNLGEKPEIFINEELIVRDWAKVVDEGCPNQLLLSSID